MSLNLVSNCLLPRYQPQRGRATGRARHSNQTQKENHQKILFLQGRQNTYNVAKLSLTHVKYQLSEMILNSVNILVFFLLLLTTFLID